MIRQVSTGMIAALFISAMAAAAETSVPSFRNDVLPVLSKSGCNLGTCHGNQHGKGGLRLSLRGQDPDRDYETLTKRLGARRLDFLEPAASLLLRKPLMKITHQGGQRFEPGSEEHQILHDWIAAGAPIDEDDAPSLVDLVVSPAQATVHAPNTSLCLQVNAGFSDGSKRDVTSLAVYASSSLNVEVAPDGVVALSDAGASVINVRYQQHQAAVALEYVPERSAFRWSEPNPVNFVDEAIFARLLRIRINPAGLCDDTTFLRRAYLDLTGLLPTQEQAQQFLMSTSHDKRKLLIDSLLETPEFSDFQALRWSDLLRVEDKTLDPKGVEIFHDWIRQSFVEHKPLNQFAAELISGRGSTFRNPPANFYRALRTPDARGEASAQVFLGIRLQCARCHNHPFDQWTQDDYYGWSGFFARVDYEIGNNKRVDKLDKHEFVGDQLVIIRNTGEFSNPDTGKPARLRLLGGQAAALLAYNDDGATDRLQQLAAWFSAPDNQRFATTQVNRIWYQLMGRGLVDPIDDFRTTNPPSHPRLLEQLTSDFVEHDFDVRHIIRLIMMSATWQRAADANLESSDESTYAAAVPARLTAEQTLDAIAQVLDIPVRFGGHEPGMKAVQLPGVRNGGHRGSKPEVGDRFLALFGKPGRLQTCECERSNTATLAQTFEMISGELMHELLESDIGRIARAVRNQVATEEVLDTLYWSALSRRPTATEQAAAIQYVQRAPSRLDGLKDVAWALLNSNEFLLRR
ncbi:MAG: DUF1549 and DUF1553 domain-containing protein [Planctomycetaceae bacterium]